MCIRTFLLSFAALMILGISAFGDILYVTNYTDNRVFSVDSNTGAFTLLATVPGNPGLSGIALLNDSTALTVGYNNSNAYSVNLRTGASTQVNAMTIGSLVGLSDIALLNNATGILCHAPDDKLFSLNLQTGAATQIAQIAGNPELVALALRGNTAYTTGFFDDRVYAVDVLTGSNSIAATVASAGTLYGITLAEGNTAYVTDSTNNRVYQVDLQTGAFTQLLTVTGVPNPQISEIVYRDVSTAYCVGGTDNNVYRINLQSGTFTKITPVPLAPMQPNGGLFGIALFPTIPTRGLSGNNLIFSNYLNANAPGSTISLFAFLNGAQLDEALEAAAPTRNAFATFASQNGFLATAQTLSDQLTQRRLYPSQAQRAFDEPEANLSSNDLDEPEANLSSDELLAFSFKRLFKKRQTSCGSLAASQKKSFNVWGGLLGEYAHEKAQNQTPAFSTGSGGLIAAGDYKVANWAVVGFGGAYLFTHLNEADDEGHANIQQGFALSYASFLWRGGYLDLAVFGGYYDAHNARKILLPGSSGFNQTARSSIKGWQLAPHVGAGWKGPLCRGCSNRYEFEPFLMGDWVANWQEGFTEHGASSLNMRQKGQFSSLLRAEAGLKFYEIIDIAWGRIVFLEKASYAYQTMFDTGNVTAFLVGSPGSFTVSTLTRNQNLGVAAFSAQCFPKSEVCYFDVSYQGEFGTQYQSHQGMLNIGKEF